MRDGKNFLSFDFLYGKSIMKEQGQLRRFLKMDLSDKEDMLGLWEVGDRKEKVRMWTTTFTTRLLTVFELLARESLHLKLCPFE